MHVFHLPHRSGVGLPAGRITTLVLWLLIVFLALMCLSARRTSAGSSAGGAGVRSVEDVVGR